MLSLPKHEKAFFSILLTYRFEGADANLSLNDSTQRWYFLGIITVAQVTLAAILLGIPILVSLIQKELGLNLVQVGLLGSVLNGGVVMAAVGTGRAADHWGERSIIGYGTMFRGLVTLRAHGTVRS